MARKRTSSPSYSFIWNRGFDGLIRDPPACARLKGATRAEPAVNRSILASVLQNYALMMQNNYIYTLVRFVFSYQDFTLMQGSLGFSEKILFMA